MKTNTAVPNTSDVEATDARLTGIDAKKGGVRRFVRCRIVSIMAAAAAASMAVLACPSIASATSISAYPDFGCVASGSGGTVLAGGFSGSRGLQVNDDNKATVYFVEVFRWTGTWSFAGFLSTPSGAEDYAFYDTINGQLNQPTFSGAVGHGYYRVVYGMESTGDKAFQYANAGLITPNTYYDGYTCKV